MGLLPFPHSAYVLVERPAIATGQTCNPGVCRTTCPATLDTSRPRGNEGRHGSHEAWNSDAVCASGNRARLSSEGHTRI